MAEVSQNFNFDNNPVDALEEMSGTEDSDDDNREDEIKKLLEEGLSNETFDFDDSDTSYQNASKFSSHNNCSFVSNKEESEGIFDTPKVEMNLRAKRVDFSSMPNSIPEAFGGGGDMPPPPLPPPTSNGNGQVNGGGKMNGNGGAHSNVNGNGIVGILKDSRFRSEIPSSVEQGQTNRETEEITVQSPTISLLHRDHCPQTAHDGSCVTTLTGNSSAEQLQAMCELRERQIQRAEESIAAAQKDKRALNHQIALMRTEMVQLKSQCDDAEKFAQLKDEEVEYLKSKIQEAIDEYEGVRRREMAVKDENNRLLLEIEKNQQEIKLLSALGSQTQQAEVSDVVRQLREKHAMEIASWQKIVSDLEGQVRTYKRSKQLLEGSGLHKETGSSRSSPIPKESVETQTDFKIEDEIERTERELAALEFQEEFGMCGETFLNEIKDMREPDIVKRVRQEWKMERDKIVNFYESEIKIYKHKLATLPSELYQMWQKTQEELGLNQRLHLRPAVRSTGIQTEKIIAQPMLDSACNTSFIVNPVTETGDGKEFKEEGVQVNFANVLANTQDDTDAAVRAPPATATHSSRTSNISSTSTEVSSKETSSVIVQTEETLETYKILASLIDSWAQEVSICKQRAELAEGKSQAAEEELKLLNKKFKQLQKMALTCRKEWKKQEESLKAENYQMKAHYLEMLKKLNEKLALVDQTIPNT